jgi:aquaporin Z
MMKKLLAELIGTAVLVLFGCGAVVLGGDHVGQLGIAFAFGISIVAMAYGIGPISGCHVNPAVSFGVFIAGRMSAMEMVQYCVAQVIGAIIGAYILYVIASGAPTYDLAVDGLGQDGYGPGYLGSYSLASALVFEIVATFIFLVVILGVTGPAGQGPFAGLAIGLALTGIHIIGIQVTGVSVNPARSIGPALIVQGEALTHLWVFIVAPLIGAAAAGALFRARLLEAGDVPAEPGTHKAGSEGL